MSIRSILAAEGISLGPLFSEVETQFNIALKAMLKEAGLSHVLFQGLKKKEQKVEVVVPPAYASLFKETYIKFNILEYSWGYKAFLSWDYTHPDGNSSNYWIGSVQVSKENLLSFYRLANGATKEFAAPSR